MATGKPRRRKKLVDLTPTHRPLTKKQAQGFQATRDLKNEIASLRNLVESLNQQLRDAIQAKANAEHARIMSLPSSFQLSALKEVCSTSALVALSVGPKFASALQELSRWYVEITLPGPADGNAPKLATGKQILDQWNATKDVG